MKKIIALLLTFIMCISLCACGKIEDVAMGTTYTSNGVEFTLNYIEFTDCIDNWGGANDFYWMPLPNDATGHRLENAMSPKSDEDTICVISYTAKNISKSDKGIKDKGTLNYDNGYIYSDGGLSYRNTPTAVWQDIPNGIVLEKLKGKSYEFRSYIVVPKIVTQTEKPLTFKLFGKTFNLR